MKKIIIILCLFICLPTYANDYFLKFVSGRDLVDEFRERGFKERVGGYGRCNSYEKCFDTRWNYVELWQQDNSGDRLVFDTLNIWEQTNYLFTYNKEYPDSQIYYQLNDNLMLVGFHNGRSMQYYEYKIGESFKELEVVTYTPVAIIKECKQIENDHIPQDFKDKFTNAFITYPSLYNPFGGMIVEDYNFLNIISYSGENLGPVVKDNYESYLTSNGCTFGEQLQIK